MAKKDYNYNNGDIIDVKQEGPKSIFDKNKNMPILYLFFRN